jgi:hypothetical protein
MRTQPKALDIRVSERSTVKLKRRTGEAIAQIGLDLRTALAHLGDLDVEIIHSISKPHAVHKKGYQP